MKLRFLTSKSAITRIQAIIIAVVIIAAAAGGVYYYYATLPPPLVKLTFLHHHGGPTDIELWEGFFEEYHKQNPNVEIEYQHVEWAELATKITTLHAAGELPDIIHCYYRADFFEAGIYDVPPDYIVEDIEANYPSVAKNFVTYEGQLYGYATEYVNYGLGYNKVLLAEAGFDSPPETLEEFWEIAEACTKYDPDTGEMIQAGFVMPSGWRSGVRFNWELWCRAYSTEMVDVEAKEVLFNNEKGLKAMQIIYDIFHTYKVCDSGWTGTYDDYVWMEKAAMWIPAAPWQQWTFGAKMGENVTHLGAVAMPIPEPGGKHVVWGDFYFLGVSSTSKHKEEAWKLLKWLNEPGHPGDDYPGEDYSRVGWYQVTNVFCYPSRTGDIENLAETIEGHPWLAEFLKVQPYAETVPFQALLGAEEINKIEADTIELVMFEALDPQEALNTMETECNAVLEEKYG